MNLLAHRPIESLGQLVPTDDQGRIVNPCDPQRLVDPWRAPVTELIERFRHGLGGALRSVYLRGSLPRGLAIEGVADVDMVCVMLRSPGRGGPPLGWVRSVERAVLERYPFCSDVSVRLVSLEWLMASPQAHPLRFLLKTQGLCVWGAHLAEGWDDYTLADARITLIGLPHAMRDFREFLDLSPDVNRNGIARRCRWIMKKIVRSGFELVATSERAYTRDLYPCWEAFSRHYPDEAARMRQVLELAVNPVSDRDRIRLALAVGDWVVAQHSVLAGQ